VSTVDDGSTQVNGKGLTLKRSKAVDGTLRIIDN
jgi:hypothetical protein